MRYLVNKLTFTDLAKVGWASIRDWIRRISRIRHAVVGLRVVDAYSAEEGKCENQVHSNF
jgi:hypothetical protein